MSVTHGMDNRWEARRELGVVTTRAPEMMRARLDWLDCEGNEFLPFVATWGGLEKKEPRRCGIKPVRPRCRSIFTRTDARNETNGLPVDIPGVFFELDLKKAP
jgi:hypothetical protein